MKELIWAECERILNKKSTKILFMITIVFQIFVFLIYQKRWHVDNYVLKKGLEISLNSLNYSVTQLTDFNAVLIFIILPLYFTECLSLEIDTGAYKMILLRPIKKWKLLVAKWIALASIYAAILCCVYLTKTLIGYIFMPRVESTNYFIINSKLGLFDSTIYNIKYYLIILVIHLSLLGITSFISVIVKKPILTFLGSIAFMIAALYLFKPMIDIFFKTATIGHYILAGSYNLNNIYTFFLFSLCCLGASLFIWNKRIGKMV
ncbi:hypothetical protein ACFIJ5_18360 (plasmid) [Haloimpatiens sp. FM7330]|uniref:hypothetical protein n=1 Tax=Haloimpatiens sp. FM7330 TaxID=3298610 RepID=UPI0036451FFE